MEDHEDHEGIHINSVELMRRLQISRPTMIGLIHSGEFPNAFRLKTCWRIPLSDYRAFVKRRQDDTVFLNV